MWCRHNLESSSEITLWDRCVCKQTVTENQFDMQVSQIGYRSRYKNQGMETIWWAELYKILLKSISITNYIFLKYFNYFCQLLQTSCSKYSQDSLWVNQSIIICLINKRNRNVFLGLALRLWLWQFSIW